MLDNIKEEFDDFTLEFVKHPDLGVVAHCTVKNWSTDAYKRILEEWEGVLSAIKANVSTDVVIRTTPPTSKAVKFAEMVGFNRTGMVTTVVDTGEELEVLELWV